mmetsp:Transcript_73039/g.207205  ORF Transcript_73039/g.207205 Transcript_73039/m.207205 type:complete len:213 (+) Transcript_73039:408-1046(+)
MHLLGSLVQKVLQLQRLDEVRVPDHAAVGDADVLVLLHGLVDDALALGQVLGVAVDRGVLLHGNLQLPAELRSGDGALAVADLVQARQGGLAGVFGQLDGRAVGLHQLRGRVSGLPAEDHEVQQRVCAQPVRAVDRGAATFSGSQEAGHNRALRIADTLRLPVGRDAAHVVVHRRQHGCGLLCHVHAGKYLCRLGDARQPLSERLRRQVIQV